MVIPSIDIAWRERIIKLTKKKHVRLASLSWQIILLPDWKSPLKYSFIHFTSRPLYFLEEFSKSLADVIQMINVKQCLSHKMFRNCFWNCLFWNIDYIPL